MKMKPGFAWLLSLCAHQVFAQVPTGPCGILTPTERESITRNVEIHNIPPAQATARNAVIMAGLCAKAQAIIEAKTMYGVAAAAQAATKK